MPRNAFRKTKNDQDVAPSSRVSCRVWSAARNAATHLGAHRRKPRHARSTITNALVLMAGGNWAVLFAITAALSGKICLIGDLPVLVHVVSQRARVLRLRRTAWHSRSAQLPCCLPPIGHGVQRPDLAFFEAQSPRPPMPLSTLRQTPRDVRRKTRGQDGFALSFPVGLFHSLQHAGLARRTEYHRRSSLTVASGKRAASGHRRRNVKVKSSPQYDQDRKIWLSCERCSLVSGSRPRSKLSTRLADCRNKTKRLSQGVS